MAEVTESETTLTVSITDYNRDLELKALGESFGALADEYANYVERHSDAVDTEVRLYVKEMREGSLIAVLHVLAPHALPFVENANSVLGFSRHLTKGFRWLLGQGEKTETPPSRRSLENYSKIVEPIAQDSASQMNLIVNGNLTVNNYEFHLTSTEANAIQNTARRVLVPVTTTTSGRHNGVVLYLYQARNKPKSGSGDTGIIEKFSKSPVRLSFADDKIKVQIVSNTENPFRFTYLVDVDVQTRQNRPALYTVLKLHEVMDPPETADA